MNFSRSIGTKAISASVLLQEKAEGIQVSFEKKINYQLNYMLSGNYSRGEVGYTNFELYALENKCLYEFSNINDKVILGLGVKTNLGFESTQSKVEESQYSSFNWGLGTLVRTDIYFTKRLCLFVEGSYNRYFKSKLYSDVLRVNGGIKLIIL